MKDYYSHWVQQSINESFSVASTTCELVEGRSMTRSEWRALFSRQRRLQMLRDWPNTGKARDWFSRASYCPGCGQEINNKQYWGANDKGSIHQRGKCKPPPPFKVLRQSWKTKLPYPMPVMPNPVERWNTVAGQWGGSTSSIETMEDFCKFWGVNNIGGTIELVKKTKTRKGEKAA